MTVQPSTPHPNPYWLSPDSFRLGELDVDLLFDIQDGDDDDPEQDERRDHRDTLIDELEHMTRDELRAYIDGMHTSLGEHLQ